MFYYIFKLVKTKQNKTKRNCWPGWKWWQAQSLGGEISKSCRFLSPPKPDVNGTLTRK